MQLDALLHSAAYAQVVRVGNAPRELHRLDPRAVTYEVDDATGEPRFRVRQAKGGDRVLSWRDVLRIPTPARRPAALCA